MDLPDTLFLLMPLERHASEIVDLQANRSRTCRGPEGVRCLRFGLDQQHNNPSRLASFGRTNHDDVTLSGYFSRTDQCYFSFNKDTGELLLCDLSAANDTHLFLETLDEETGEVILGESLLRKNPRQCAVLLAPDRKYTLRIGTMVEAWFRLLPRAGEAPPPQAKLKFANQTDPDRTRERPLARLGLQPQGAIPYQEPQEADVIKFAKLRDLGSGGQGDVCEVVDLHNGNHYACKIIAVRGVGHVQKQKLNLEIEMVRGLQHRNIVPYLHAQGFRSETIEIFMPVYDGSFQSLAEKYRDNWPQAVMGLTERMLSQILDALNYIHTHDPPIIHRDIKPANILYRGDRGEEFFLTDFGVAKVEDNSKSRTGTEPYLAPEVVERAKQTSKIDIYSLGVSIVDGFSNVVSKFSSYSSTEWFIEINNQLQSRAPQYKSMLERDPNQRPSAQQLLQAAAPPQPAPPLPGHQQASAESTSVPEPMDWFSTPPAAIRLPGQPAPPPSPASTAKPASPPPPASIAQPPMPSADDKQAAGPAAVAPKTTWRKPGRLRPRLARPQP